MGDFANKPIGAVVKAGNTVASMKPTGGTLIYKRENDKLYRSPDGGMTWDCATEEGTTESLESVLTTRSGSMSYQTDDGLKGESTLPLMNFDTPKETPTEYPNSGYVEGFVSRAEFDELLARIEAHNVRSPYKI